MSRFSTIALLAFVFISQIAFSQVSPSDSLTAENKDSLSRIEAFQKKLTDSIFSSEDSKFSRIQLSLDSISKLTSAIKNKLDSSSTLNKVILLHYKQELSGAQEKVKEINSILKDSRSAGLDTLDLTNDAYAVYFKIGGLKTRIDERIRKLENQIIKRKAGYIWNAPTEVNFNALYSSFKSESLNPLTKLKNLEWGGIFLLLIFSAGYFYWVFQNQHHASSGNTKNNIPIAQSLLFFFILMPLFNRAVTIASIDFILLFITLITVSAFKNHVNIHFKRWRIFLIAMYVAVLFFNYLLFSNAFFVRTTTIFMNVVALYFGYNMVNHLKKNGDFIAVYRAFYYIFILLNIIAIFSNIIGQINVSKTLSITAMSSGAHLLGLIILGRIITENINKQIEQFKTSNHFMANLDPIKTIALIHKALFIMGFILWLMVFLINLNFLDSTLDFLTIVLNKRHALGSFNFSLGNIISFIIIIKVASWLQKNLNTLLSTKNKKAFNSDIDEKGTKVALLRLLIIIIGFLMAVAALGISMTKLTVIVGALSVGIGLGMQNIFNNFVSGVILIFEKPFKIGDFISLGDKKGRVQKIGIRSSTLLTDKGSEIIIPNGDLLSGHLINWTHSHSYYNAEFSLKFTSTSNVEEIKTIILQEISESKYLIKDSSIEILYKSVSVNDFELIIKCWIVNIYKEPKFKSTIIERLRTHFTDNEIVSLG